MMTTKVFQRVLAIFLVVAAIFFANGLNNVANAEIVQIYDGNVNDILNTIREVGKNYNFSIRGTHYYTGTDGFRYCESYFGDSDKNRLVFQVNNNGAVSSAWIIAPMNTMSGEYNQQGSEISGLLLSSILITVELNENEVRNLIDNYKNWHENNSRILSEAKQALDKNNPKLAKQKHNEYDSNYPKTFSVWCTKSKRYIDLNFPRDDSTEFVKFFITAHT